MLASKNYFFNNELIIRENENVEIVDIEIRKNDNLFFVVESMCSGVRIKLKYIDIYSALEDGWNLNTET
jgi:hypothetical protein